MTDTAASASPPLDPPPVVPPVAPPRRSVRGVAAQSLGQGANLVVWGSIIVSVLVTCAFSSISLMLMNIIAKPVEDTNAGIINQLWSGLLVLQTGIVNYWCGSSAGSARKDHVTAAVQTAAAPSPNQITSTTVTQGETK